MPIKTIKGKQKKPGRWLIFAGPKWGKSTLATHFPKPIFIDCEDGLGHIDCTKTEVCETYRDAWGPIVELGGDRQGFETIVVDTIDWLERLLIQSICEKHSWETLADGSYGKGVQTLETRFREFINSCEQTRKNGLNIVFLAHAKSVRVSPPGQDAYDRWQPKCHDKIAEMLFEWCENVLFGHRQIFLKKEDQGFNQNRQIATTQGDRILYCQDQPFAKCGNRVGLPEEILADKFLAGLGSFFDFPKEVAAA